MMDEHKYNKMTIKEISDKIHAHLERLEEIQEAQIAGKKTTGDTLKRTFFGAVSWSTSKAIWVKYISYQINHKFSKTEAIEYLEWLDAGNVGNHYRMNKVKLEVK